MKKRFISALVLCAFFVALLSGFGYSSFKSENKKTPFASKLVEIYKEYGSTQEGVSSRLILSDYNGENTYGAADFAVDKAHSLAVLQYESEEKASRALDLIKKDGISAERDATASLDSAEKGSVFPEGSNAIGSPSYISKFEMSMDEVIVAVIDTGVMYDHELMETRFVSRGYDFSDNGRNNAYYDTSMSGNAYGHGTFVCGIIADNTADNVKLLPYKVVPFGSTDASNSAIVAAIYDAVDKGASVINISMSATSGSNAFKYAVQTALNKNVCVCASAGNDSKEIKYRYPAATPGVITASALESDMQSLAAFSNFGSAVDFCAPGRAIVSACPYNSGDGKYTTNSGTSFSAPYISAVCADIKSINNSYSKDNVYDIICDFAVDLGQEGYDVYYGNGLPDISKMLYTDRESYTFSIPEGNLEITSNTDDYTPLTQPWRLYADKLLSVSIDNCVDSIGSYSFYNMKKADINMSSVMRSVGEYAFYSCKKLKSIEFDENIISIGQNAFGELSEDFTISGYRNTAAEFYSQKESISFNALGCKHNYLAEVFEPTEDEEGYTLYTCSVCGDSYLGEYIEPPEYYEGECGMGVFWRFSTKAKTLEIIGSGYMTSYSAPNEVPWNAFMSKIKSAIVGENITYISDYLLYNAVNAESLTVLSKTAKLCDGILFFDEGIESDIEFFAFDDSCAKDYFAEKGIEYSSLGCAHSRNVDYYEEQPSCCYDTWGVYTCADCNNVYREYISLESKGHYFSGSVSTLGADAIIDCEVFVDGKLSAKTNAKGQFVVYPVLCGEHSVEIKKHSKTIESFNITIDKTNMKCKSNCCFGDIDENGYVNAKDYAFALKNGFDDGGIFDFGRARDNERVSACYEKQELPYALEIENEPNDADENKRDFTAIIENNSEFEIKECGFIYGKNMSEDMLYIEKYGMVNDDGFSVKRKAATDYEAYRKVLSYKSSDLKGTLSARFYIIYTNGVEDFLYYSNVSSYTYPD